ncbi:quinone oxidoreductase family protein [Streptosporangium sp. DT93]|uniref:quinone oxidoreductase family protein n=1 Tax=Streptosporangium sp. DT93 TaxID=3393428 RepID=UPI003CF409D8
MRAIRVERTGNERCFPIDDLPEPVPGPGELLVRTEAIGVGVTLVRSLRAGTGATGAELVGRVAALGPGTRGFRVGQRVGGVVMRDAFAEAAVAQESLVSPVPEEVDAAPALCLVRGGLIALSALRAGHLARGESVLVTGAASGVGHLAVQLARALGAGRVVAAVGSPDKAGFAYGCGADEVVTYDRPSWGDPVDLVLDGVGGDLVQRGVDGLLPLGRLVAFSAGGGVVDTGGLLSGPKTVIGFSIGPLARRDPGLIAERRAGLWEMLAAGDLRPAHTAFPLERLADAVTLVGARRNLGRVLLRTAGDGNGAPRP